MDRRTLLKALAAAPFAAQSAFAAPPKTMKDIQALQNNWKTFLPAGATVPSAAEPLKLSKDEWKKRLQGEAFKVLREEGTERAGTSPLNEEKRAGVYACAGCGLPHFTSEMKFASGTACPRFSPPFRARSSRRRTST
jgi:peptide-methionine (R)-S-oxide reductase